MTENLDYVVFDPDRRGNPRYYLRLPGRKKVRIRERYRDEHGNVTKAFRKAYEAALKADQFVGPPTHRIESFRWLIDKYERSGTFEDLDPSTQRARSNILKRFAKTAGDFPYKKFRRADAKASHDKRKETPAAADNLLKALRQLFNFAIDMGLVSENPCAEIRNKWRSTGHPTWPTEDVDRYRAFWPLGTRQRLAMEIMIGVGVRRSDCTLLGRQHEKSGWLKFISHKGRKRDPKVIEVPIRKHLRDALDAGPTGDLTYLVREDGEPYSIAGFGNMFRDWCLAAGITVNRAHGLRKAAAVILAENGATAPELCAVFGWNKLETAQIYIRMAEKRKLARNAFSRLGERETDKVVSLVKRKRKVRQSGG